MTSRHSPEVGQKPHVRERTRRREGKGTLSFRASPRLLVSLRAPTVFAGVLLAAAAVGQEQAPPAPEPPHAAQPAPAPADAATLLRQAREKLAGYRTLKAKMTETVEFGPRRFKAEGDYLQGADNRVRVDLTVAIGENKGRLLQVSDGLVLWTVYDIGPKPRITRRDINQILAAAKGADAKATQLAELGLGGMPALLASIERSMDFKPPLTAEVEGRTFYVLEGEWKPELRQQFQNQAQQLPNPTTEQRPLPAHVPDLVRIYLDAETFFPYRIRYLKRSGAPGVEPSPVLTLDFRDIVVNASLDPSEFQYVADAEAEVADITSYYLQQLKGDAGQGPGTGGQGSAAGSTPPGQ